MTELLREIPFGIQIRIVIISTLLINLGASLLIVTMRDKRSERGPKSPQRGKNKPVVAIPAEIMEDD